MVPWIRKSEHNINIYIESLSLPQDYVPHAKAFGNNMSIMGNFFGDAQKHDG